MPYSRSVTDHTGAARSESRRRAPAVERSSSLWAGRAFFLLVALAAILCGLHAGLGSRAHFERSPGKVFPPELREQLRAVEDRVPPGAFVLYVPAAPEFWYSRLWQRALYPRNEVVVLQPPVARQTLRELRVRYGARFAVSAGDPPTDPGFLWRVDVGRAAGTGETWVGELRP